MHIHKKRRYLCNKRNLFEGLTEHAGTAVSSNKILHIPGGGSTTKLYTLSQWKSAYTGKKGDTWVYRPKSTSIATKAGNWAYKNYWNKNMGATQTIKPSYSLKGSRFSKNPTYCSKIVYQAYYGQETLLMCTQSVEHSLLMI
ncbi:hypothetical protein HCA95_15210 [Listeria innocua]|uniref:hypothetical protein n=1 Tax=Listeria monocytogenes TaxID=1639 RepID=UPI0011EB6046|nr:hypothetical protein [Listeria monocytogenes]MBC2140670.1 hypothetical protein [Listeria innocua]TYV00328.1 hypothetical protein FZ054_15960 [Listeria monocytogenes]